MKKFETIVIMFKNVAYERILLSRKYSIFIVTSLQQNRFYDLYELSFSRYLQFMLLFISSFVSFQLFNYDILLK